MLIVSLIFGILVCFAIPVGGLVLLGHRKRGKGMWKAFLWGALAFTVSQLLIRVPLLQMVLPQMAWFAVLQRDPWAYGLFLGVTAGMFEEGARWIAMKCFLKGRTDLEYGLAFGLGHGGIEAMLLVGVNLIVVLASVLAGFGTILPVDPGGIFWGGFERIYAMGFHVGASLLVLYGIRKGGGRMALWLAAAILLHTVMDAAAVILLAGFGVGIAGIEIYGAIVGFLTLGLGIRLYRGE